MRAGLSTLGLAAAVVGALTLSAAELRGFSDQSQPAAGAAWTQPGDWTADTRNGWRDDDRTPRLQLNLRAADGADRWGFGVRVTDLQGLPDAALDGSAADVRFTLAREAGSFAFTGSFAEHRGAGRFTFTPNPAYTKAMAALGYPSLSREDVVRLAVLDVSTGLRERHPQRRPDGARHRRADPLPHPRRDRRQHPRARGPGLQGPRRGDARQDAHPRRHPGAGSASCAPPAWTADDPEDVIRLRIHNVTPEFIAGLKTRNYTGLLADDYVKMRIHGVSLADREVKIARTEDARLAAAGWGDELVKFSPRTARQFIRDMRAVGFTSVDEQETGEDADSQRERRVRAPGPAPTACRSTRPTTPWTWRSTAGLAACRAGRTSPLDGTPPTARYIAAEPAARRRHVAEVRGAGRSRACVE